MLSVSKVCNTIVGNGVCDFFFNGTKPLLIRLAARHWFRAVHVHESCKSKYLVSDQTQEKVQLYLLLRFRNCNGHVPYLENGWSYFNTTLTHKRDLKIKRFHRELCHVLLILGEIIDFYVNIEAYGKYIISELWESAFDFRVKLAVKSCTLWFYFKFHKEINNSPRKKKKITFFSFQGR